MLKKIKKYYNDKKQIVDLFCEHSKYFVSGRYTFDKIFSYIYKRGSQKKLKSLFENEINILYYKPSFFKSIFENTLRLLFIPRMNIKPNIKPNGFIGTVFLPARRKKNFKIFDFRNKKVLLKSSVRYTGVN